jgi:K+-sensing histidine kinase KdpD
MLVYLARTSPVDVISRRWRPSPPEVGALLSGLGAIGALTAVYSSWLGVTNPTIVALTFLLVVLIVAAVSRRWVAIATSLAAFLCFNYFFLPPVGAWTIADPENLVALFTLLAVSLIASHLSAQVRQREQEATARRKEAELVRRGDELKSALLASLSHDLKTPLTAVTVAANNLDAEWLTPEQRREQAEIVRAELDRLNRMFQDIVDMAKIETNAILADPEWVEPEEIVEAAVVHAERALTGHALEVQAAEDHVLVRLDPRLTSAALAHVLENAGQYSPPGSTIVVTLTLSTDQIQIAVRDHGAGIAREDVGQLFERSYRGVTARRQRPGTGMGLSITHGLLAAQGGRVWAENHPDGGAVFTIAVPAGIRSAAAIEAESL